MCILLFWYMHREGVWAFTHPPPSYSCADVSWTTNICSENVLKRGKEMVKPRKQQSTLLPKDLLNFYQGKNKK